MASRISRPPERILRSLYRGVSDNVRSYRAAVCKTLKKPLIVENMPGVQQLKNSQVFLVNLTAIWLDMLHACMQLQYLYKYENCRSIIAHNNFNWKESKIRSKVQTL